MWELCERLDARWGHRLGLRAPGQASSCIRLCLRCLLLHSRSHLFWRDRKRGGGWERVGGQSWFMPPLLPFPVLIYENKIPVNSSSINTRQLWGQAFSYTAQCKRLALVHAALVMCFGPQCRSRAERKEGPERRLAKRPWQQTHFISPHRLILFPSPNKSTGGNQEHRADSPAIINASSFLNTCQCFSFFSALLFFFHLCPIQLWTETHPLRPHPLCFSLGNRKKEEKVKTYVKARGENKPQHRSFFFLWRGNLGEVFWEEIEAKKRSYFFNTHVQYKCIANIPDICGCGVNKGTIFHCLWQCPRVAEFREDVGLKVQQSL